MSGLESLFFAGASDGTAGSSANLGSFLTGLGQMQQGASKASASSYNANVATQNAAIARQNALANAAAQQRSAKKTIGSTIAGFGSSGLSLTGSALDVLEESSMLAELDRQNIMYEGELKAIGYENEARLARSSAKNQQISGLFSGFGATLLTRK